MNNDDGDSSLAQSQHECLNEDGNNERRRSANEDTSSSTNLTTMSNWQRILSVASAHQEAINGNQLNLTHAISSVDARAVPHQSLLPPNLSSSDRFVTATSAFHPPPPASAAATHSLNYDIRSVNALQNTFAPEIHYPGWPAQRLGYAALPRPTFYPPMIANYGIHTTNNALNIDRINTFENGGSFQRDAAANFDALPTASGLTNHAAAFASRPDIMVNQTESAQAVTEGIRSPLRRSSSTSTSSYIGCPVSRLSIPTDAQVLDRVNNFLRGECIETFMVTRNENLSPGGGLANPSNVGQVGFRCSYCKGLPRGVLAKQAIFFPSRRDTIFECVRNFRRSHLEACPCIPERMKAEYKRWVELDDPCKKSHQYLKAYYAEAASEIGLVDDTTKRGLTFGGAPNTSGIPSARLRVLIQAAEHPDTPASAWRTQNKDKAIQMKKFEHVSSAGTRNVILNARRTPSDFVYPQDFPTVPDFDFLLLHQLCPIKPTPSVLEKKGLADIDVSSLSGLCCKHCARAKAITGNNFLHKGVYFPTSVAAMIDSSFSQTLLNHIMNCNNVPPEVKSSLDELKGLADTHSVKTRRGVKRRFFEKIWERITTHFK
ncbi:hypothetical protein ACHAXH_003322 [Discostella pseudostelligera]